jgi:hypothetical protein
VKRPGDRLRGPFAQESVVYFVRVAMSSEGDHIQDEAAVRGADGITETPRADGPKEEPLEGSSRPVEAVSWRIERLWIALAGMAAVIVVGWAWCPRGPLLEMAPGAIATLAGVLLLFVSAAFELHPEEAASLRLTIAGGLSFYALLLVLFDPFRVLGNEQSILWGVALLAPFVIGGLLMPTRGWWLPGIACWCLLFSATVALTYNANHDPYRSGDCGLLGHRLPVRE